MTLRRLPSVLGHLRQSAALPDAAATARLYAQLAITNKGLAKGPGGRSSVSGLTATIFGCSSFLGRYVVQELARTGTQCVLPYRCDELDVQHLKPCGDLGQIVMYPGFDLRDPDMVKHAVSKSNVVINMIGADRETWNYKFEEVHVDFAKRIAEACAENKGVERLLHVSCLGASESSPSKRLQTKAAGEKAVREIFPKATILKSGYMVGTEDKLTRKFADLGKKLPFAFLVDGGHNKIQPVYVRDVADSMVNSLNTYDSLGSTYHLAGPKVYTLREFSKIIFETMREPFYPMHVPYPVVKALGTVFSALQLRTPPLPISHFFMSDFIAEMTGDHVLPAGDDILTFADLKIQPSSVTEGEPIEHVRYFRAGGYEFGTTAGTQSTGGASFGSYSVKDTQT